MRKPKFRHPEHAPPKPLHLHDMPVGAFVVSVCWQTYGANFPLLSRRIAEHTPRGIVVEDVVPAGRTPSRTPCIPSAPGYWTAYCGRWYIHSVHETLEAADAIREIVNGPRKAYNAAATRARKAFARIRAMALPGHMWTVEQAAKRAADLEFLADIMADGLEALK